MINEIVSTIIQIAVLAFIPFIVFVLRNKNPRGFFDYIGLKRSTGKANRLAVLVSLIFALPILVLTYVNTEFKEVSTGPGTVIGGLKELESVAETIFTIVLIAVFKTSLSEEIFFRGFVAKRLINSINYRIGNLLQAILFGLIHVAIFLPISNNAFFLSVIFFFPTIGAYLIVYLNEKMADGSILPGWIAHGLANLFSYGVVVFLT